MSGPHLIRLLVMSSGGIVLALIGIVFYVYLLAWRRTPHQRGLIPRHVVGVSIFTVIAEVLFLFLIADLIDRDAPLSIYGPLILVANVDLIVSLGVIYRYDRRRVSAATGPPGFTETPQRRAEDRAPPERRWWGRHHP